MPQRAATEFFATAHYLTASSSLCFSPDSNTLTVTTKTVAGIWENYTHIFQGRKKKVEISGSKPAQHADINVVNSYKGIVPGRTSVTHIAITRLENMVNSWFLKSLRRKQHSTKCYRQWYKWIMTSLDV